MTEFPSTTHGFAPQPAAVAYMLEAWGTPAQLDANLQASADRLVRVLEFPPPVDAMECHGGLAEAQAGRRQQLANIIDARHALALELHARRNEMAAELFTADEVRAEEALDAYMAGDPNA